ncbi:MAG: hypothetical protein E7Z75_03610 [Methanobrevibacter olleyae]|uniref:DUF169 domain-containing protein n=1 Tax=Methanobrevibacter olleyae TaxID=294671 RepID=A0A8T3VUX8_METOL|nr:hypothetical protein [Methanobrevibacter olleyae]
MDYKKEDNVKTAEVLKEKLNLTRHPVAIKFFNDESEIPEGVEKIGESLRHCEMVTKAAEGVMFYSTAEEQKCKGGSSAMGLEPLPPKIASGEFYYKLGRFDSVETAKSVIDSIPRKEEESLGIIYAPLEEADFIPDVIVVITLPKFGMYITQGIVYNQGGIVEYSCAGIQSLCADAVSAPYVSKKANATLACNGSRSYAGIEDEEIIYGLSTDNIKPLMEAFENI